MWPWEHVVLAYLAYSICVHLFRRRSPTGREAVVVAVASVLPDLVDKPLGWELGVFPSGFGVAHSIFFAVPLALAVLAITARRDALPVGAAFATGYLSHLPADVLQVTLRDGSVPLERLLWPVRTAVTDAEGGFEGVLVEYVRAYYAEMTSSDPGLYVVVVALTTVCAAALWLYDGAPGLRGPVRSLARRL